MDDGNTIIPEDGVFEVKIRFKMTCAATYDQIEEWARGELCQSGGIDLDNPLMQSAPDAVFDVALTDLKKRYCFEEYDHKNLPDGSRSWKRKSWVESDVRRA